MTPKHFHLSPLIKSLELVSLYIFIGRKNKNESVPFHKIYKEVTPSMDNEVMFMTKFKCPYCRSAQTTWKGYRQLVKGRVRLRKCKNCGRKFTPRVKNRE